VPEYFQNDGKGPRQTQYFCTQYRDIKIKRHFDKNIFFLQNIVVTNKNIFKQGFNQHNVQNNFFPLKYWMKNVFLSLYCNIFLSQYCVKKYCL